jgi:hypothetical protein
MITEQMLTNTLEVVVMNNAAAIPPIASTAKFGRRCRVNTTITPLNAIHVKP